MSLSASAILSLSQAKQALKIEADGWNSNWDAPLEEMINASSDYIEQMIGNKVVMQDVEEILDGSGGDSLFPTFFPIVQLVGNSIPEQMDNFQVRDDYNSPWQNLFSSTNQYALIKNDAIKNFHQHYRRLDGYTFPEGIQNIRHFARRGYQTVPAVIKQCCSEMVEILWKDSSYGNSSLGKESITKGNESQNTTTKLKSMDKRWKELMGAYIREELK
jgi:hypothetical protein